MFGLAASDDETESSEEEKRKRATKRAETGKGGGRGGGAGAVQKKVDFTDLSIAGVVGLMLGMLFPASSSIQNTNKNIGTTIILAKLPTTLVICNDGWLG
jgi:hypothetical protein